MRLKFIWLMLPIVLLGCGGGGGGGTSTPSPFVGSFLGTYDSPSVFDDGNIMITVGSNGNFTGQVHDNGANTDGTFNGHFSSGGSITATVHYNGQTDSTVTGTVTLNGANHITGNLTQHFGQTTVGVSVDLAKI